MVLHGPGSWNAIWLPVPIRWIDEDLGPASLRGSEVKLERLAGLND